MKDVFIENGVVTNITVHRPDFTPPDYEVVTVDDASPIGIGWDYVGGGLFSAPVQETPTAQVESVTDLQLRLALAQMGLLDAVEAYVAAASVEVKIWWERATNIERHNAMVIGALAALNKTSGEGDALFALAKILA